MFCFVHVICQLHYLLSSTLRLKLAWKCSLHFFRFPIANEVCKDLHRRCTGSGQVSLTSTCNLANAIIEHIHFLRTFLLTDTIFHTIISNLSSNKNICFHFRPLLAWIFANFEENKLNCSRIYSFIFYLFSSIAFIVDLTATSTYTSFQS